MDVNRETPAGSALHEAVLHGRADTVNYLIDVSTQAPSVSYRNIHTLVTVTFRYVCIIRQLFLPLNAIPNLAMSKCLQSMLSVINVSGEEGVFFVGKRWISKKTVYVMLTSCCLMRFD